MAESADRKYMERALELAAKAKGKTAPNPMVGALLVKAGKVIGEGYHRRAGQDHAEIVALKAAGRRARNATLYVTLEPCCHVGRTGPCADALIESGVKRVVVAMKDPDPRVRGRGLARLRSAGVEVSVGLLRENAQRLNEAFVVFHSTGRPLVTLKIAQTLDGRVATANGDSQWITGKEARTLGHALRAENDGIVVGMGTVRADNPSLTVRHVSGRDPFRVIVGSHLRFPNGCRLISDNKDHKTIIASSAKEIDRFSKRSKNHDLTYWVVKTTRSGLIDLNDLVAQAAAFGLRSLLIEGGPTLATSFLRAGLVDKLVVMTAPKIIGAGTNAIGDLGIKKLVGAIELERTELTPVGNDIVLAGYVKKGR
ncbi:bifunctional diaminohydroxyphosphoribosylaminopyrimidine deaminase/5-amino-6-(5-phosphoribosylamino)uracil reductase RibD [bacterium]|nr:bifunctional diaminohydroxyphosphoribosylaminopyrimidine deaminase/5-amino-6-(5-phosphoribosylamino)uracil reductase RibD [bacterium]MCB2201650.1 bifunctional diaminohydroxyphosphoribosylaminopyrimidine deaminase/5-amino-6-(5-phosphoribosylamino)uracil reductase RibD [bacterium]